MKSSRFLNNFILLFLAVFIVGGNTLTFLVAGRVAFRVGEILGFLLGLCLLAWFIKERLHSSIWVMLVWGVLSLVLMVCNTLVYRFTLGDLLTGFLYLFRFLYFLMLAYVLSAYLKKAGMCERVLKFVNICYLVVGFIGLLQLLLFPVAYDFYNIFYAFGVYFPNPDPHINRLISTYFDPNYLACCLLIGVVISIYLWRKSKGASLQKRVFYGLSFLFYCLTILLTKSRSGLLGLAIIAGLYLLCSYDFQHIRRIHLLFVGVLLFAIIYLVFFSNITVFVRIRNFMSDPSAQARFNSWAKSFEVIKNTGFLGVGYNLIGAYNRDIYGFVSESTANGADSSLLLIMMTTGLWGLLLWGMHLYQLFKIRNNALFIGSLTLAALIVCNFNNLLFYSLWVFPFYFTVYLLRNCPSAPILVKKAERRIS